MYVSLLVRSKAYATRLAASSTEWSVTKPFCEDAELHSNFACLMACVYSDSIIGTHMFSAPSLVINWPHATSATQRTGQERALVNRDGSDEDSQT